MSYATATARAAAVIAVTLAAACSSASAGPGPGPATTMPATTAPASPVPPGQLKQVHDPGTVTGTLTGPCHARGQLPDPACTPGAIDPAVTQQDISSTICARGYTATVRPPAAETDQFKYREAYPAYGLPQSEPTELDHLVPLELGGANDAANLWPQSPPTPNAKDKVENALRAAVCAPHSSVSLAAAQLAIARDWTTAEQALGLARQ